MPPLCGPVTVPTRRGRWALWALGLSSFKADQIKLRRACGCAIGAQEQHQVPRWNKMKELRREATATRELQVFRARTPASRSRTRPARPTIFFVGGGERLEGCAADR